MFNLFLVILEQARGITINALIVELFMTKDTTSSFTCGQMESALLQKGAIQRWLLWLQFTGELSFLNLDFQQREGR